MLGKLLKYELKGTALYFLPLFAAILVFSLLIRVSGGLLGHVPLISGLMIFIEVLLIVALAVMILVITIQRFYKNLLGSEGYLMFTLPVSTHHNILSKLLAATLWNIAALLVIALSVIIMASSADIAEALGVAWRELSYLLRVELGLNSALMLFVWIVVGLISVAQKILLLYLAMAIGQLANERKFLASFGAFLGIQCLLSAVAATFIGIVTAMAAIPGGWLRGLDEWIRALTPALGIQLATLVIAVLALAGGALYYFLTHWLLKRKLNLI